MSDKSADPHAADLEIAALAGRQHGVVSTAQLLVAGLTRAGISRRVKAGRLHKLHRGVYAVGHTALTAQARWLAAALALGSDAVLCLAVGGAIWELLPVPSGAVDVALPSATGRKRREGIRVHRFAALSPHDITEHNGFPVTTPMRTIFDLAATTRPAGIRRMLEAAEHQGLFDLRQLERLLEAQPRPRLTTALEELRETPGFTRSEMEARFIELIETHDIRPRPRINASINGDEVDAVWRDQRLAVEYDSWQHHRSKRAFQRDRTKGNDLTLAGYTVLRFTWEDLTKRAHRTAAEIASALQTRTEEAG